MTARWLSLALLAGGCLPRVPVQRLSNNTPIVVAYVVDPSYSGVATGAPEALTAALTRTLEAHNLSPQSAPLEVLAGQRLTDARKAALKASQPDAPYFLLVELRAHFFSQLDGRYRWEVGVALTALKNGGLETKDSFEVPVILMYDHEKQPAALNAASFDISTRLGALLDGLLQGANQPSAASGAAPRSIYFAMVDRFENGDLSNDGAIDLDDAQAFHGGDLQGLIDRLDWLQQLGVDTVWLSPVFAMRTEPWHGYGAFHGYWTYDLNRIEPRFGDERLLARLADELHRRKMKLLLDLVLNHVGPDAPLVAQRPEWFHRKGGVTNWNDEEQLTTFDVHGLPDLATERDDVFGYLTDTSRRWLRARSP